MARGRIDIRRPRFESLPELSFQQTFDCGAPSGLGVCWAWAFYTGAAVHGRRFDGWGAPPCDPSNQPGRTTRGSCDEEP